MRRNVDFNGLGPQVSILAEGDESGEATLSTLKTSSEALLGQGQNK